MIVCTGPIASGTRLMYDLAKYWGLEAEHRSMPQWTTFWSWEEYPADTQFIVVTRRPDISVRSAYAQGHGDGENNVPFKKLLDHRMDLKELDGWWWQAIDRLSDFPRAWWLSYEAVVANPERQLTGLADWLGIDNPAIPASGIYDGNERWRDGAIAKLDDEADISPGARTYSPRG